MKGLIQLGLWNAIVISIAGLGVFGLALFGERLDSVGLSRDFVNLLLVPLTLGGISAFMLRGRWWIRILLSIVPPLISGMLLGWTIMDGHSPEKSLAIGYLMVFVGGQAFVAVLAAFVFEGIRIRRSGEFQGQ